MTPNFNKMTEFSELKNKESFQPVKITSDLIPSKLTVQTKANELIFDHKLNIDSMSHRGQGDDKVEIELNIKMCWF